MITNLFIDFLMISLITSLIILVVILISRLFGKRYNVKWRYWIWLVIAVRLLLPFNFELTNNLFQIDLSDKLMEESIAPELALPVNDSQSNFTQTIVEQGNTMLNMVDILAWIWLILVLVFFVYHLISYFLFRKDALRWSQSISNQDVVLTITRVFSEMNVSSSVPVLTSEKVPNPMLVGFLRPILFLPHETYTQEELQFIIKHELIHYKRKDILYKLLLLVVQAIHWFNPLIWFMVREASRDIEIYCDYTMVERHSFNYRKQYCEAIYSAMQSKNSRSLPLSTNFARGKKLIKSRFMSILTMEYKKNGLIPFLLVTLLIVIAACTNITAGKNSNEDISKIIHEHLGISPYVPETKYELGTVLLEYHPQFGSEEKEPLKATISYFESLDELEKADEEMVEWFEENDPLGRDLLYGDLYPQGRIIFIEIYPGRIEMGDEEVEDINVLGHDIQYVYYEKGGGRDLDMVMMTINFDDVGYSIEYLNRGQSENIEEEAKELAEDIIKNNS